MPWNYDGMFFNTSNPDTHSFWSFLLAIVPPTVMSASGKPLHFATISSLRLDISGLEFRMTSPTTYLHPKQMQCFFWCNTSNLNFLLSIHEATNVDWSRCKYYFGVWTDSDRLEEEFQLDYDQVSAIYHLTTTKTFFPVAFQVFFERLSAHYLDSLCLERGPIYP